VVFHAENSTLRPAASDAAPLPAQILRAVQFHAVLVANTICWCRNATRVRPHGLTENIWCLDWDWKGSYYIVAKRKLP